ncbi:MAG: hypothetical protein AB4372_27835 [Xenococcus sp. (in: cyanobacteria)]
MSEKVDLVQQAKDNYMLMYAQTLGSMLQQSQIFTGVSMKHLKETENADDCYETLERNLKGIKAIIETNTEVLDQSIESMTKLENYVNNNARTSKPDPS